MGLNLSNQQIAQELSPHKDDVHQMTSDADLIQQRQVARQQHDFATFAIS